MTTATVAAILTVLGYSIYDTIIVFDRVRENMPLMPRATFATIANVSLWETMRRSLATTFITLLPVGRLLLFGGATLKDFAFALFIGIGLGAFSTFFVATPFLTVLMEREPEFRAAIGTTRQVTGGVGGGPPSRPRARPGRAGRGARSRRRDAPSRVAGAADGAVVASRRRSASSGGSAGGRGRMAEPASRDAARAHSRSPRSARSR